MVRIICYVTQVNLRKNDARTAQFRLFHAFSIRIEVFDVMDSIVF